MPSTLIEKIIQSHLNGQSVHSGEIALVPIDRLLINDYAGKSVFSQMEKLGWKNNQPSSKVLVSFDHSLPPFTTEAADILVFCRNACAQLGIDRVADIGQNGIGHQLMIEHFVQPYEIAVGTDSHATMYGGLGCFAFGITATDAAAWLQMGRVWIRVPETIKIRVRGQLQKGVTAKDLSLKLIEALKDLDTANHAIEMDGEAIHLLSVDGRLVLCNMLAECGIKSAICVPDESSFAFAGSKPEQLMQPDEDAAYEQVVDVDAGSIEPLLSYPGSVQNVKPLLPAIGTRIHQAFIGSCTNGRMEDLIQAAEILKGNHVAKGTRLIVVPASQTVYLEALKSGILEVLIRAGACILNSSCASCFGNGPGLIGKGEVCISTTNRNFSGRMGSKQGEVYLGSAYAAAAAAVAGFIEDPRKLL